MEGVLFFILTLAIAVVGSVVARKIRMPAGGMLGAMITVAAFNLLTHKAVFPEELRIFVQMCSGAMIGSRITKKDVVELKLIIVPTLILIVFMVIMNIVLGVSMHKVGNLNIATAMFASSPGGMSDMALLAEDMGANSSYVTLLQLIRLLTIYTFMPGIIKGFARKEAAQITVQQAVEQSMEEQKEAELLGEVEEAPPEFSFKIRTRRFIVTLLIAAVGGGLFHWLGVTAGAMLGAMLAVAIFNITTGYVHYPPAARNYTQVFTGAFLGMKMDMASLLGIGSLLVPAAIEVVGVLAFAFLTAFIISKFTKLSFCTSLMACTPGGLQEMSILSEELGMDTPKVAVMQVSRLMFVIALFPTMIPFVASLF